jgi:hypothetical protein
MIDICSAGAEVSLNRLKLIARKPIGIFLYAAVTGSIGVVILVVFFAMVISPFTLAILLPAIIGFNGAVAGYNIIDKGGIQYPWKKSCLAITAAILALTGVLSLSLLYPWDAALNAGRYLFSGGAALALTFFGSWLAVKNKELNQTTAPPTEEERLPE